MPTPDMKCPDCNKKMSYDSVQSVKSKGIKTAWCVECGIIMTEKRFVITLKNKNDKSTGVPITSVRRYVFKGELPKDD